MLVLFVKGGGQRTLNANEVTNSSYHPLRANTLVINANYNNLIITNSYNL